MKPFLKWPGGKRWIAGMLLERIPKPYGRYFEPFLGGGAMFFALSPQDALISDINPELINLYEVMRDSPLRLKELMCEHQGKHCKEYYYEIRASKPLQKELQAARLLYLNRTCYNGMYRVNSKGEFNVPIGTKDNCIYDVEQFQDYSKALKNAEIAAVDFCVSIEKTVAGDVIFADPPYASASKEEQGFVKYNDKLFTWQDQVRLHQSLVAAKDRGVTVFLTNANCQEIRELYANSGFIVSESMRSSNIAGITSKRAKVQELLIST